MDHEKFGVKSKRSAERGRETPDETGSGKDLGNFTGYASSRSAAHFHAARAGYSTATYDPISAFLSNRLFKWIPKVAKYRFRKKHAFRDYTAHGKGTGIYLRRRLAVRDNTALRPRLLADFADCPVPLWNGLCRCRRKLFI
jgi:hypothetical protein